MKIGKQNATRFYSRGQLQHQYSHEGEEENEPEALPSLLVDYSDHVSSEHCAESRGAEKPPFYQGKTLNLVINLPPVARPTSNRVFSPGICHGTFPVPRPLPFKIWAAVAA